MKYIRKGVYYFFITVILIISGSAIATVIYKNEIMDLLKDKVERGIKTKLEVDKVDLKLLRGFPNISIKFQGVKFHSKFEDEILLISKSIYFKLNVWSLFKKDIVIESLEINEANIIVHVNKLGERNFDVFVKPLASTKSNNDNLNLKSVFLTDVGILVIDDIKESRDYFKLENLTGSIMVDERDLQVNVASKFKLIETNMSNLNWMLNKKISINTKSKVTTNTIAIFSSEISIEKATFKLNGVLDFKNDIYIDLAVNSNDLEFRELVSVLPKYLKKEPSPFNGKGKISWESKIKGNFTKYNWPRLEASFRLRDFEIRHSDLIYQMSEINLHGEINIDDLQDMSSSSVRIVEMSSSVNGNKIKLKGVLNEFDSPQIIGDINGKVEMSWVIALLGSEYKSLGKVKGLVAIDCSVALKFDKDLGLTKNDFIGKLEFDSVSLSSLYGLPLNNMNGTTHLNADRITIDNLSASYGVSDVNVNGYLELVNNSKLGKRLYAKLGLKSNFLDLDEILGIFIPVQDSVTMKSKSGWKYNVKLGLELEELKFLKFIGKDVDADIYFSENLVTINKATANGMGGAITIKGSVLNQFNGDNYIRAKVQTKEVYLDSLFYVFDDFNQNFITANAIKGELNSNVYTYLYFNSDWDFKRELLYAEATLTVKNGQLNNFEPVMSLSTYLNEESENLAELRFSDIENQFIISNDTVFISEMSVGTNVRNIRIGGYHTFNQQIDYKLAVPVITNKKDNNEEFGKVKTDQSGQLYFPFRIRGTTSDYRVTYDFRTASSNFVSGVKKEMRGLGKAFIGNKKQIMGQDSTRLDEEEFFDWEDN